MGSLTKINSIKQDYEFSLIYRDGKKWFCDVAVIYFLKSNDDIMKFSPVASKKVGNAVKRNRAKRLLRASFMNFQTELKSGKYIIIAKSTILEHSLESINSSLRWSFKRLDCLK